MNTTTASPRLSVASVPPTSGPVVGVRTTRIYCRPVCRPGRAPKRENCIPFINPTVAKREGFRACKQCRPDDPAGTGLDVKPVRYATVESSIGLVFVAGTDRGICALSLLDGDDPSNELRRLAKEFPGSEPVEDRALGERIRSRLNSFLEDGDPCT